VLLLLLLLLLQGPLASLDLSAHVLYRMTRCRLASNQLAFSISTEENAFHRAALQGRLAKLRQEYDTLLYGGKMLLAVRGANRSTAGIACSTCYDSSTVWLYAIAVTCLTCPVCLFLATAGWCQCII
jgi:hypothetical protein